MIDLRELEIVLLRYFPNYSPEQLEMAARHLIEHTHPDLQNDLEQFANGGTVPTHPEERYSLDRILSIDGVDPIEAFDLLTLYKKDPAAGASEIEWRRSRRN